MLCLLSSANAGIRRMLICEQCLPAANANAKPQPENSHQPGARSFFDWQLWDPTPETGLLWLVGRMRLIINLISIINSLPMVCNTWLFVMWLELHVEWWQLINLNKQMCQVPEVKQVKKKSIADETACFVFQCIIIILFVKRYVCYCSTPLLSPVQHCVSVLLVSWAVRQTQARPLRGYRSILHGSLETFVARWDCFCHFMWTFLSKGTILYLKWPSVSCSCTM